MNLWPFVVPPPKDPRASLREHFRSAVHKDSFRTKVLTNMYDENSIGDKWLKAVYLGGGKWSVIEVVESFKDKNGQKASMQTRRPLEDMGDVFAIIEKFAAFENHSEAEGWVVKEKYTTTTSDMHYVDFAKREGIVFDVVEGMPHPTLPDGSIIARGKFDAKAEEEAKVYASEKEKFFEKPESFLNGILAPVCAKETHVLDALEVLRENKALIDAMKGSLSCVLLAAHHIDHMLEIGFDEERWDKREEEKFDLSLSPSIKPANVLHTRHLGSYKWEATCFNYFECILMSSLWKKGNSHGHIDIVGQLKKAMSSLNVIYHVNMAIHWRDQHPEDIGGIESKMAKAKTAIECVDSDAALQKMFEATLINMDVHNAPIPQKLRDNIDALKDMVWVLEQGVNFQKLSETLQQGGQMTPLFPDSNQKKMLSGAAHGTGPK